MSPPRDVLIVEDLPSSQDWLVAVLAIAFPDATVRLAASLAAARECIAQAAPDLALVDLGLPDGSGVDLILALRERAPGCACVVTTIYADDHHLFPALRAGATGYLLKDAPQQRLATQLRGIVEGEPPLSPAIARRLLQVFEPPPASEAAEHLSPRERETLVLIAKGYRLNEVAESLGVTRNTAAGYIKSVYRKLAVSSRAEATLAALRLGLVSQDC